MHIYSSDWNRYVQMDNKEYSYLYSLISQYCSVLPTLFIDALHKNDNPTNEHLVNTHFFLEHERMLKLAHVSMDNKNAKFMHDLQNALDALDRLD